VKSMHLRLERLEAKYKNANSRPPVRFARFLRSQGKTPECYPLEDEEVVVFEILDDLEPGERLL